MYLLVNFFGGLLAFFVIYVLDSIHCLWISIVFELWEDLGSSYYNDVFEVIILPESHSFTFKGHPRTLQLNLHLNFNRIES